jgi:Sulfotransferase family
MPQAFGQMMMILSFLCIWIFFCTYWNTLKATLSSSSSLLLSTDVVVRTSNVYVIPEVKTTMCPPSSECYRVYPYRYMIQAPNVLHHYLLEVNRTRVIRGLNPRHRHRRNLSTIQTPNLISTRLLVYEKIVTNVTTSFFVSTPFVFCHIHKNGGTTLFQSKTVSGYNRKDFLVYQEKRIGTEAFLQSVNNIRRQWNEHTYFFSFLRDPVARFASGLRQMMINRVFHIVFSKCQTNHSTTTTTTTTTEEIPIDCVITILENSKSYVDSHLLPQLYELYHCLNGTNYGVVTTALDRMNDFVQNLGISILKPHNNSSSSTKVNNHKQFTMSQIQRICQLYHMDVDLIRHMRGTVTTPCIDVIEKS